eukprot:s427_g6.t1
MYVGFRGDLNYAEKEGRNAAWALQRQVRWSSMTCHLFLHATCQNIDVGLARNGNVVHRDWQPADILDILPGDDRKCLDAVWQVAEVDLVDQEAADKTRRKRHRYVFTKLRAFQVPYRKLIFFDLDIIIRSSPKELFQVTAPAGMYHGHWNRDQAAHGQEIPAEAFYNSDYGVYGCINAGLMRLDTLPTAEQRRRFTDEMLKEAMQREVEGARASRDDAFEEDAQALMLALGLSFFTGYASLQSLVDKAWHAPEAVLGKLQDIGEGVDDDRQGPGSRDFGEVENFHFAQATGATETPSFSAEQSQYRVERSGRAVQ